MVMLKEYLERINEYLWKNPEDASEEFSVIFEGTNFKIHIDLWESSCMGPHKVMLNERTFEVVKAYADAGVYIKDGQQPPDFLGYETEFLLYLLARGDFVRVREFWHAHYAAFLTKVLQSIVELLPQGVYSAWASSALANLQAAEEEVLALTASSALFAEQTYYHFTSLSSADKVKLLEEKIINTAGRGNCGGKCIIKARVAAGCVLGIETDTEQACEPAHFINMDGSVNTKVPQHTPVLKACVRGLAYRETFLRSDRLKYPLVRVGKRGEGRFRRISWDEAFELIQAKMSACVEKYGVGCRYINYCSGISSIMNPENLMARLLGMDGGFLGHYLTYSSACAKTAIPMTYGTMEIRNSMLSHYDSKLLVLWGYNPVVTAHGYEVLEVLRYHKKLGTPIIVIDPQFSDTARAFATKWLPIRPGTDAALVAAIAYVLWEENLCDYEFMNKFCLGLDKESLPEKYADEESYKDYVYGSFDGVVKTPAWAEELTGISAQEIIALARLYGKTKPAAIFAGLGPQRTLCGEQTVRSIMLLPCMTGNVGLSGGGTGARGSVHQHHGLAFPEVPNPYRARIPSFLWTEAVRRGHEFTQECERVRNRKKLNSDIKIIFNLAGNTLLNQHSDVNATKLLLEDESKVEFIVASDIFMTPSVQYADLVLPGVSMFEECFMAEPWNEGNYLLYGNKCMEPLFQCRSEFSWMKELAERIGYADFTEDCQTQEEWLKLIYNRTRAQEAELPEFEVFASKGGYKYKNNLNFVAFTECQQHNSNFRFPTPSGKIEFFSEKLLKFNDRENIPPIPKFVGTAEGYTDPLRAKYPLQLIGWHSKRRTHSVHDNNELLEKIEPQRLWINPRDAEMRGIANNMQVLVYNDHGKVQVRANVSDRIMEGVVCLPQGAWFTPNEAGTDLRGSVNVLTHSIPTAWGKCNGQHTALVEVKAAVDV